MDVEARPTILLVEDDPVVRRSVSRTLSRQGFEVVDVADADEALTVAREVPPDVALIDIGLPDGRSGIDVMRELKRRDGAVECVIFTGDASASVAVEAYDAGAVEFFEKPITDWQRFRGVLDRAVRIARLTRQTSQLTGARDADDPVRSLLIGGSPAMESLRAQVARLAPRSTTVLLLGPTGAGKTRVARALHAASGRRGSLEVVNCGGLHGPTMHAELFGHERGAFTGADARHLGAFERAAEGTLLLDEIGDLDLELQATLLTVLEDRTFRRMKGTEALQVRCRVVAATNRDVDTMVREGTFRADLANRLGIRLDVPSLDDRRQDIPQLVYTFLEAVNAREGLDIRRVPDEVMEKLVGHDWGGENLRGLRTAVERMAIFSAGDHLDVGDLQQALQPAGRAAPIAAEDGLPDAWRAMPFNDFKEAVLREYVGRYVKALLDETDGNVSAAARLADLHAPNFRRLIRRYELDV